GNRGSGGTGLPGDPAALFRRGLACVFIHPLEMGISPLAVKVGWSALGLDRASALWQNCHHE
ncbi:MAG: hypothetical protein ACPGSQ_06750, partial [Candidatus Puniceispirillaceae bacterium]